MSVLGLNSGYTVKYNPLPSGKGLYLTIYLSSCPNTDTVSTWQSEKYGPFFPSLVHRLKTSHLYVVSILPKLLPQSPSPILVGGCETVQRGFMERFSEFLKLPVKQKIPLH